MSKFSQALVNRITAYFATKYEINLSHDEAEAYLNSLADLYLMINSKAADSRDLRTHERRPSV